MTPEHLIMDKEQRRLELLVLEANARHHDSQTEVSAGRPALDIDGVSTGAVLRERVTALANHHGSTTHLLADIDQALADYDPFPTQPQHDPISGDLIPAGQDAELERMGREMASASLVATAELSAALERKRHVDEETGELWVQRTFADVRAGDRIRLGSGAPEARITARYLHPSEDPAGSAWHVVPSGETGPWAHKSDMVVQPGEVVLCSPDINAGQPYRFKPEVPVEIWLPRRATLRAVEAWGWDKRLDFDPARDQTTSGHWSRS